MTKCSKGVTASPRQAIILIIVYYTVLHYTIDKLKFNIAYDGHTRHRLAATQYISSTHAATSHTWTTQKRYDDADLTKLDCAFQTEYPLYYYTINQLFTCLAF